MSEPCSIDGCDVRAQPASGLCKRHYKAAWYRANRERTLVEQAARKAAQSPEERERRLQMHRDYYRRNRERTLAAEADRYRESEEYREIKKRVAREWREANLDRVRKNKQRHYEQNKDEILARSRAYYEDHREQMREANRRWVLGNPERALELARAAKGRRRAREYGGKVTRVDLREILNEHGMICHLCGGEIASRSDLNFDHVVPLARGGEHSPENLRPAHASCNRRKGARLVPQLGSEVVPGVR